MKKAISIGALFGVSVLMSVGAYSLGFFDTWEEKMLDRFFLMREPSGEVIVIAIDNESINAVGQWPWPRAVFADVLERLHSARVIGIDVNFFEPSRLGDADDFLFEQALKDATSRVVLPLQVEREVGTVLEPLVRFSRHTELGVINVTLDSDGILRSVENELNGYTGFGAVIAQGVDSVPEIMRVDYAGPEKTLLSVPLVDVIQDRVPERIIEGKIVLIGATADDLHDIIQTPFGNMPGVELHGNVIETLLGQQFFTDISRMSGILAIVLVNLLTTLAVWRIRRFTVLTLTLIGIFAALFVSAAVLFSLHIVVPLLYLLLGFFITGASVISFEYISESREKRFIRNAFSRYLAPDVIDEINKDPSRLKLGGEKREVTILFSDIRGFTTISEALSPEELMSKLNEYLTAMTEIILNERGLVDKYIGDAIMAFWGAPLQNDRMAYQSARVVIKMVERLAELNKAWEEEGTPLFHIGIGLSQGEVIVGNLGSEQRFDYTIIGDEVNFSARLEGLNKPYGTTCIIGENIKKKLEEHPDIVIRELDLVMVKGKKEPKKIFELITKEVTESFKKVLEHFEKGRVSYTKGDWDAAIASFEQALEIEEDGPSKVFHERSQALKTDPPKEWTGVYEFTTK